MQACHSTEAAMSISILDSDSEEAPGDSDEEDEEARLLRHATTLRLDDFVDPRSEAAHRDGKVGEKVEGQDRKADTEADMWKRKCEEMAAMIAQLQKQQQQPQRTRQRT